MKRLFLLLILPVLGFAQGVNVPGTALKSVNGVTSPFPGATITVCGSKTSGFPCSPALNGVTFQDEALSIPLGNPFTADSNGNWNFFISPGSYTVTITGAGFAGYSYQLTAQCPLKGACAWTGTLNLTGAFVSLTSPTTTGTDSGTEILQNKTLISPINGLPTVAGGIPILVAKADANAQAANISSTPLYAVPANGAGFYRLSAYAVITQAATVTSQMPSVTCAWTDNDSSIAIGSTAFTSSVTANTVGTGNSATANPGSPSGSIIINVKAGTNISWGTSSYSSSGATAMQYAIHLKLEYLGQ